MIVFLHGWLMDPSMWAPAMARLDPAHRTLALRQPAHGGESGPAAPWSMADWAAWAEHRIAAAGDEPLILVGHSMGGMLAQALAARRKPAGLVLVGTTAEAWPPEVHQAWLGLVAAAEHAWSPDLADQIAPMLMGQAFLSDRPDWRARWAGEVQGWDRTGMSNLAAAVAGRPDMSEATGSLGVPTLVVHGEADVAIPLAAGRDLAGLTGGDFLALPGVGHCPPLEAPDAFAEALAAFVARTTRDPHVR
ncbi:MAG: alpha/beta hydrolase [Caulobacter sp.]